METTNPTRMSSYLNPIKVTNTTFKALSRIITTKKCNNSKLYRKDLKKYTNKTFSFNSTMKAWKTTYSQLIQLSIIIKMKCIQVKNINFFSMMRMMFLQLLWRILTEIFNLKINNLESTIVNFLNLNFFLYNLKN